MASVEVVQVADVDQWWPLFGARVNECARSLQSNFSAGDLWTMCRTGQAILIVAHDGEKVLGATIWQFETWPDGPVIRNLVTVGEDLGAWQIDMHKAAKDVAIAGGANRFVFDGRNGWKRLYPAAKTITRYILDIKEV